MRADRLSLVLTYSIAVLGVGAAALHISPLYAGLLALCIVVGAMRDWSGREAISAWLLNFLSICGLIVALALPSAEGAVGRLLVAAIVLMGGKLLGPKAARDQLQMMLLSLLLLIGAAILTLDLSFALLFVLYLALCTIALTWLPFGTALGQRAVDRAVVRRVTTVGVGLVVGSLPLVLVFFVALPRTASPYWRGVGPAAAATSGFSDQVSLGDVARVAQSDAVAFRAELVDSAGPLDQAPYWRGMVLETTDGITWAARDRGPWEDSFGWADGSERRLVRQRIYLEPHGLNALFCLDRAVRIDSAPLYLQARVEGGTAVARRTVGRRVRYEVTSSTAPLVPTVIDPATEAADLAIPASMPRVVVTTARQIVGAEQDPQRKAELIAAHFREGGYTYSLTPPPTAGHPLEAFLTTTKTGYCEHFASAAALMLRSVGVPARLVVGYVGGDYNETGDYYLVRQRAAHAWVEAYIEGKGWLRLDPTPPGPVAGAWTSGPPGRITLFVDALRLRWQSMIMGYDLGEQLAMVNAVSSGLGRSMSWRPGASSLADLAMVGLLVLAVVVAVVLARRGTRPDPVESIYRTLLRRLARRGLTRGPAEGPADFAERAAARVPERAATIRATTDLYVRARYAGRRPPADSIDELRRRVRKV